MRTTSTRPGRLVFQVAAASLTFGLLTLLAAAPAFAQRRPSKVAVLVGVEKYRSGRGFEPLRFTVDDVEDLGAVLKRYGFSVVSLTDSDATKGDVLDTLDQLGSAYELEGIGTAVFFFSGHGFSMNGEHYLAAYDTRGDDLAGTALRVKDVEAALTRSGAVQRMLWIDACRSSATRGTEDERSFSRAVIMSAVTDGRITQQRWRKGWNEDWDKKNRDEGFVLSLIVPNPDESIYVMNKYSEPYNGWSLGSAERFPGTELAERLAEGYRVVFVY